MNARQRRTMVADLPLRPGSQYYRSFPSLAMGKPAKNGCSEVNHFMQTKLLSAWHQLAASKASFHLLKQDLLKGMAEANDIFNSMSIPLVRLVGLKMQELSAEGRQTSISLSPPLHSEILQACSPPDLCSDNRKRQCSEVWQSAISTAGSQWPQDLKEENLTTKAARHAAEFSLLQKQQLRQLVGVVKMVERLVRSQEESIAGRFKDCESYLETLQQSGLLNFKNLHQQVMDMRQQDSLLTYRLRVAEQSYQALMSLAVKIQESGIEKVKRNLLNVKAEVEGMVNELANSMCKPLIAFLKEMKGDNGTSVVVSKLQRLVTEMDSKISLDFQTLATANDEYKARVKKIDFQLQARSKEVERMSLDGAAMHRSLEEKVEEIEALKVALAVEAAEKQNFKSRLDGEIARACRLEEELKQKEAKLADAVKLLQATKLQLAHEHSQVEDTCTKSKELCSRLSDVENRLSQSMAAVTTYLSGDADVTKDLGQLAHVHQADAKQQQVCSKSVLLERVKQDYWHLWREFSRLLTNEVAEMQSRCPNKAWLQEAVVLIAKHCDNQEPSGVLKEENLPNSNVLPEQIMKNAVNWLVKSRDMQGLQQNCPQQIQDNFVTDPICLKNAISKREEVNSFTDSAISDPGDFTLGFWLPLFFLLAHPNDCKPNQGTSSIMACSDICSQGLKDLVSELQAGAPGLSEPSSSLFQLLAAVGMMTIFKAEFASSQAGSHCNGYGALPQQQQEQQRRDAIQHDDYKVKLLKYESSSASSSTLQGLCGSKRSLTGSDGEEQDNGTSLEQIRAKKAHTCKDAEDPMPQSQEQNCPPPNLHPTLKGMNGMHEQSTLATMEGQNDVESLSILLPIEEDILLTVESKDTTYNQSALLALEGKTGVNKQSTLPTGENTKGLNSYSSTLEAEKENPNQSAKELWQVLELGPDISCNDTKARYKNGESTALDLSLAASRGNQQNCSEPLLVLRDDVRRLPRPSSKRASPRLLARRLADSPYPSYR